LLNKSLQQFFGTFNRQISTHDDKMTERLAAQYASRVSYMAVRHLTWHILHTAAHCINALYPADIKKNSKTDGIEQIVNDCKQAIGIKPHYLTLLLLNVRICSSYTPHTLRAGENNMQPMVIMLLLLNENIPVKAKKFAMQSEEP